MTRPRHGQGVDEPAAAGSRNRRIRSAAWGSLIAALAIAPTTHAGEPPERLVADAVMATPAPGTATDQVETWIVRTADNQGLPYLIIDKIGARVLAFDRQGRRLGETPALVGLARGDVSPPGIGDRPLSTIGPEDRITPAGRFVASLGENLGGKGILWIDYDAALSLHAVVTTRAADRRRERLATVAPDDNRISYGCINVPAMFYEAVIQPAFGGTIGIVYILPEVQALAEVLPGFPGS